MEIVCCQWDLAWEDRSANFDRIESLLRGETILPGSLLAFPELCTVGFSMNVEAVGEPTDGESARFFSALAKRYSSHVIAGIAGRGPDGRGWNEAVCFAPSGRETARYRKIHLFPLADEGRHYAAGTEPMVFSCGDWTLAPAICYDLRFPELFRHASADGAEFYVVIANWPMIREDHWITLLRARAIENQAYVAGVNRCGSDPHLEYSGASLIVGPTGEILARAGSGSELVRATLERPALKEWRARFPALADRKLS